MSSLLRIILAVLHAGIVIGNAAENSRFTTTTIAGTGIPGYSGDGGPARDGQINNPYGLTRGPDRALYVCEIGNHVIRRISPDGILSTVAGNGTSGYSGDGGLATAAQLNEPYEVRFDAKGHMFFVEMRNHIVRRVDARTGIISTVAGTGQPGFAGDNGPATQAQFRQPHSIQFDAAGNLYICDIGNHRIRRIDHATRVVRTFAGTGLRNRTPDGAPLEGSPLNGPRAIDFDGDGILWLALREGNAVFKLNMEKQVWIHAAGTGEKGFSPEPQPATHGQLSGPKGLAASPSGDIYLADTESHSIRKLNVQNNSLERVAGTGAHGDGADGDAAESALARPHGVFVDADGSVWVGDSENHKIRRIHR